MPWKGNDFQHTRDEALAALTGGKYGEEHDTAVDEAVDLENGVRAFWADQLRKYADAYLTPEEPEQHAAFMSAAALLDPYSKHDGDGSFARTRMDDRPEGSRWVTPV
jgi:hypothetical protein